MKPKSRRQRSGVPADIARLDFHDWWGNLIDRIKGKVTQKNKGLEMLEKIEGSFSISEFDRKEYKRKMMEWQHDAFTPTEIPKSIKLEQAKFSRDEDGNITSPFTKYGKEERR